MTLPSTWAWPAAPWPIGNGDGARTTWPLHPRGRSCHRGDVQARNAAIHLMTVLGPRTGLATLRAACPTLARGELQNLQRRFRRLWRRNHRRLLRVLHWHRPGTVWAMDHTDPPGPIDGRWPHILAVRDLASRMQLGWLPVASETPRRPARPWKASSAGTARRWS